MKFFTSYKKIKSGKNLARKEFNEIILFQNVCESQIYIFSLGFMKFSDEFLFNI